MKNLGIALAVIAALTVGALSTAQAQGKGRRDGVHQQRHTSAQHRAGPRKFRHAVDRRQARQHKRIRQGWRNGSLNRKEMGRLHRNQKRIRKLQRHFGADGHYTRHERRVLRGALDRSSKRIWRMKHNRHAWKPGYRKHRRHRGGFRRPYRFHRHYRHGYRHYPLIPVHEVSPGYSRGLEIETPEFRFSVNASG